MTTSGRSLWTGVDPAGRLLIAAQPPLDSCSSLQRSEMNGGAVTQADFEREGEVKKSRKGEEGE
jgi:hypothetical protein